ncbi:MAG TPA: cation-translocating P-type ATPase [Pseudonocardiaceae bacterium]|nr:cation-translocating P-type ATPase [Pseudonocardiaceae bacterium]
MPDETVYGAVGLYGAVDLSQTLLLRGKMRFFLAALVCMASSGALSLLAGPTGPARDTATAISLLGLCLGYPLFWVAAKTILFERNKLTSDVFVTLALIGVLYLHSYWYASWIVFIMWLGEILMAWAGGHARLAVEELLKFVPQYANVMRGDGRPHQVPVRSVAVGDVVVIQPGERIPVDGAVIRGQTSVDQSMLTGESVPVDAEPGDQVFAGTFNLLGTIQVRTATIATENTVAKIVGLMRNVQADRLPVQATVDRFMRWFLPVVLVGCVITFIVTRSVSHMTSVLLVITPCAFVASTPLAMVATIGNAARRGIVIKNGSCLEALARADVALVDKTGTLTTALPVLAEVQPLTGSTDDLLQAAAVAERSSTHPLARAVVDAALARGIEVDEPDSFRVATGHGVRARWRGRDIGVGNERFLAQEGLLLPGPLRDWSREREEQGRTLSYLVVDGEVVGALGFLAMPRRYASGLVTQLRRFGIRHIIMLTGDRSRPAQAVAGELGIEYVAEATPETKVDHVMKWRQDGHCVVMVGDGINDATALAAADVGIAIGGDVGTEIAASAADIAVHGDRLGSVLIAARLARRAVGTVKLNIFFATFYNVVGLGLAVAGLLSPGTAVLFHFAAFGSVVVNSALVLLFHPKVTEEPEPEPAPADTRPIAA